MQTVETRVNFRLEHLFLVFENKYVKLNADIDPYCKVIQLRDSIVSSFWQYKVYADNICGGSLERRHQTTVGRAGYCGMLKFVHCVRNKLADSLDITMVLAITAIESN